MAKAELDVTALVEETFEKHFGVTLDRLRELAEADKEGRCVVLPCKVGNAVYQIFTTNGERRIASYRMSSIDVMLTRKNEFGKTVFLTREAAEAALKAGDTP